MEPPFHDDGDPANDDDPKPVRAPADLHDIPNAHPWGLLALAALIAAAGVRRLAGLRT